uniref:Uncharacterized protein n=1 Tax=Anopheles atroparvus TaxID=41427 RepID=A0A182JBE4_ANOAO
MKNAHGTNGVFNPGYSRDSGDNAEPAGRRIRAKISQVIVTRPHYQQEDLNNAFNYFKPKSNFYQEALESMREMDTKSCITGLFPIFQWAPEYKFPSDLIGDMISGITVGVMHIPQGMGYALLANMPPITGIYTAFFPVFIYFLFGTSRHNSMASLSRAAIQYLAGGKTQITGLVSCSLLAVVLLFVASFFEPLPRCILASIIAVSVQGLLMQAKDLPKFWRQGFFDGVTWVLTFVSVVFVSIDIGLIVGFTLSVSTIFFRALKPYMCQMGNVPNSDVYLDITRYEGLIEYRGIKIIHYSGGLHFASRAIFKNTICQFLNINLTEEIKRHKAADFVEADDAVKFLILDFTALSYIDPSAISTFKLFVKELESIGVQTLLAGCSPLVFEKMKKCNFIGGEENFVRTYPTIHDAVHYAQKQLRLRAAGTVQTIQEVRL